MKYSKANGPPGFLKTILTAMAVFGISAVLLPGMALATTAANAVITNTATVNYDDTGGNPQVAIQSSVNVTVNLVEAATTLSTPIDATTSSGLALDYTYTITTNANGLDIYTLSGADNLPQAGMTSVARVFRDAGDTADITTVTLGATSVAAGVTILAAGSTAVTVPNDGAADATLNGLVAADRVWVNGAEHTVASIVDNATGTSTLTLNGNGTANVLTVGMQIGERVNFISRVTPIATVNNSTFIETVTATDGTNPTSDPTTTTVLVISLTVTKYVANLTTPVVGGGSTVTLGGVTYYITGVTGLPGETLEYVIGIVNAAAAATATDIVISDPIPAFTTYTAGTMQVDPDNTGFIAATDAADDGDRGETDAVTVYLYAGAGGNDTAAGVGSGTGGSLPANTTTYGRFRVTIDN